MGRTRERGVCPTCERKGLSINIGIGPNALGRGDVREHKAHAKAEFWCRGGAAKPQLGWGE